MPIRESESYGMRGFEEFQKPPSGRCRSQQLLWGWWGKNPSLPCKHSTDMNMQGSLQPSLKFRKLFACWLPPWNRIVSKCFPYIVQMLHCWLEAFLGCNMLQSSPIQQLGSCTSRTACIRNSLVIPISDRIFLSRTRKHEWGCLHHNFGQGCSVEWGSVVCIACSHSLSTITKTLQNTILQMPQQTANT